MTTTEKRIMQCENRIKKLHAKIERLNNLINKKEERIKSGKEENNKYPNGKYILQNDIEWHKDDIARAKRQLTGENDLLEKYKEKRKLEIEKENSIPCVPAIESFLQNWRNKAYEFYVDDFKKVIPFLSELKELDLKYTEKEKRLTNRFNSITLSLYNDIDAIDKLNKILDNEVKRKREELFDRVCKVVGDIIDASNLKIGNDASLNGIITGKNGRVNLTTIYAGGYNIQCLHYRVLIHKIK